jgi:putative SOS response-associated peptidase YedK
MCYFVEHNIQRKELEKRFNVKFPEDPRYTPAFFQSAFNKPFMPVITGDKRGEVQLFQWGLIPFWTRDEAVAEKTRYTTANARSETVWEKPSFRKAIQSGRCLVSAHGFFEYHTTPELKVPYYIRLKDNDIFAFAGIYDSWTNKDTGEIIRTFSILTTSANHLMEKIHNLKKRMPVILPREKEEAWLDPSAVKDTVNAILKPFPENNLEAYTVSRDIALKNPDIFDPRLIKEFDYKQNPGLFL